MLGGIDVHGELYKWHCLGSCSPGHAWRDVYTDFVSVPVCSGVAVECTDRALAALLATIQSDYPALSVSVTANSKV